MKKFVILVGIIITMMVSSSCLKQIDYYQYHAIVQKTDAPFLHKGDTIIFGVYCSNPHQYYIGLQTQVETYKTNFGDITTSIIYDKQGRSVGIIKSGGKIIPYNSLIKVFKREGKYHLYTL